MAAQIDINELHWLLDIVQNIDVGVVVLDLDYRIEVWNSFMENHSGRILSEVSQQSLFAVFAEIDEAWFRAKAESVVLLGTRAFSIWEQRPYLVHFKSYQPITGVEAFMYQNVTLLPLRDSTGAIAHICVVIYDVTDVAINKRQLEFSNDKLQELSRTDRLTGLANRGYWEERLTEEFARHQRYGGRLALMMLDIDHFKRINDTYGHAVGDQAIKALAGVIKTHVRNADIAGRYGGEEFGVVLLDTAVEGARLLAERLREAVEAMRLDVLGTPVAFTISIGITDLSVPLGNHEQMIQQADRALYESKHGGRNRVSSFVQRLD